MTPGHRIRVYLQAGSMSETDVREELAESIYQRFEKQKARDLAADMIAGLKAAGRL